MIASNWYNVVFKTGNNAAWNDLSPFYPDIPASILALANASTPLLVWCEAKPDANTATIHWLGGRIYGLPTAVIDTESLQTNRSDTLTDGTVWNSIRLGTNEWIFYDASAAVIKCLADPRTLGGVIRG
jgi:hypothetical protein